jgi:hypothetical protein
MKTAKKSPTSSDSGQIRQRKRIGMGQGPTPPVSLPPPPKSNKKTM